MLSIVAQNTLRCCSHGIPHIVTHDAPYIKYSIVQSANFWPHQNALHQDCCCICRTGARSCMASGGGSTPQPCCTPTCCTSWYPLACLPAPAAPLCQVELPVQSCTCLLVCFMRLAVPNSSAAVTLHYWLWLFHSYRSCHIQDTGSTTGQASLVLLPTHPIHKISTFSLCTPTARAVSAG